MADSLSRSKLKRRKVSSEGQPVKTASSGTPNRTHSAASCSRESAEPSSRVSPAAAAEWWSSDQLTSVETLWALTLQCALPHLEEQQLVPQLPPPRCSASQRPPQANLEEQRWCDLSEEVAPFPEFVPALLRTSSGPSPSSSSPLEPARSAQTPPEAAAPSETRPHQKETSTAPGRLPEGPQPVLPDRGREPTSALADSRGSAQDTCQNGKVAVVKEGGPGGGDVCKGGVAGGGGGGLQSCPMCLLEFPAGSTQMECDGHLARCLSEVNVDVAW